MGVEEFRVEPVALNILGPLLGDGLDREIKDGRVKISSRYVKYPLYRRKAEHSDEWFVVDDWTHQPQPLDQSVFEDTVLQLLK